ncbi:MAG: hypothetical protein V2I63_03690 [Pseudomonadales bacterium]|jgi:hypothetical protein|nr:hypothetical protein [Pseudomonadales bacterium]
MNAGFLARLLAALGFGVLVPGLLGLLAVVSVQFVYLLAAAGLAAFLFSYPGLCLRLLGPSPDPDSRLPLVIAMAGASAGICFAGLGAFALAANAVDPSFLENVWRPVFPFLPAVAGFVGLGRTLYRQLMRWAAEDA